MPNAYQTVFGGNSVAPALPTYLSLTISANSVLGWPLESNITSPAVAEIIDVTATAPGLTIQLSDARQVGTGYCALFNNVGANTVTILDAAGNTLMAPASGQVWQIYLADNSTLAGTWRVFQYGAGVSSANAASLAGSGLKAITTTLNERIFINPQAINYTIVSTDRANCIEWTGGAGGVFTLTAAATLGSDWFCYIKNSGTGVLTLTPASGTVDGSANKTFNPNDSCILVCDGSNFFTMGFGQSVASSFNFVTISLAAASGTVVLSGAQLNRISYKFTGALAGNVVIQVPSSIQQYWVDNETTGAFTLTVSAGGAGSTFTVPQASRVILYCDGLNIVNAVSAGAGATTLVADGTAAAPGLAWASETDMGLYKVGVNTLGISTAGTQRGTVNATGQWVLNAPSAGTAVSIAAASAALGLLITGANTDAARIALTDGNAGNRSWQIRVGAAATGTLDIFDATAVASRIQVSSLGAVVINNPGAGATAALTVGGVAGGQSASFSTPSLQIMQIDSTNVGGGYLVYTRSGTTKGYFGDANALDGGTLDDIVVRSNASLGLDSGGGTRRITVGSAGNVTFNSPASGNTVTINGIAGASSLQINAGGAGPNTDVLIIGNSTAISQQIVNNSNGATAACNLSCGNDVNNHVVMEIASSGFSGSLITGAPAGQVALLGSTGLIPLVIMSNHIAAAIIDGNRAWSIPIPAAGVAFAVNGLSNSATVQLTGGATAGQSLGLLINSGTNSSDYALLVQNQTAGTGFFEVRGDGIILGRGPTNGLTDMSPDQGTFTGTLTGGTTSPTMSIAWYKVGKQVTLSIPGQNFTSNATTFTITGLPAELQPATLTTQSSPVIQATNNGAQVFNVNALINPGSGTITLSIGGSAGGWTNAGVKAINACSFSYLLT